MGRIETIIDLSAASIATTSSTYNPTTAADGGHLLHMDAYSPRPEIDFLPFGSFAAGGAIDTNIGGHRLFDKTNNVEIDLSESLMIGANVFGEKKTITPYFDGKTGDIQVYLQQKAAGGTTTRVKGLLYLRQFGVITKTVLCFPIGGNFSRNGAYAEPTGSKKWKYVASEWAGCTVTFCLQTTISSSNNTNNAGVQVYNDTTPGLEAGTEVLSASSTPDIKEGGTFTPIDGNVYTIHLKGDSTTTGNMENAWIVAKITNIAQDGTAKFPIHVPLCNRPIVTGSATYVQTQTQAQFNRNNYSNCAIAATAQFSRASSVPGITGTHDIYDPTGAAQVAGSEQTGTAGVYEWIESGAVTLPTTQAFALDNRHKRSPALNVATGNGVLVLKLSNILPDVVKDVVGMGIVPFPR